MYNEQKASLLPKAHLYQSLFPSLHEFQCSAPLIQIVISKFTFISFLFFYEFISKMHFLMCSTSGVLSIRSDYQRLIFEYKYITAKTYLRKLHVKGCLGNLNSVAITEIRRKPLCTMISVFMFILYLSDQIVRKSAVSPNVFITMSVYSVVIVRTISKI